MLIIYDVLYWNIVLVVEYIHHLPEEISKRVLDMREISILRQQDDGKLTSSQKTSFDLKTFQ